MTIWGAMIVVLFAGLVFTFAGAVLIELSHQNSIKRSNGLAKFITDDVKEILYDYTDYIMKKTIDMTTELQKKMMEDSDDPLER